MYAKCGELDKAQEVFDDLPIRNVISWNALITGYAQCGQGEEALWIFEQMQLAGFPPDAYTLACILKACGMIGALDIGQEIHTQIVRELFLAKDLVIGNALVDMYAKCGALNKAQEVFDRLLTRDVVTWNGLIGGYVDHGYGERALSCFEKMQEGGLSPNAVSFTSALKACSIIGDLGKGEDIHNQLVRACLLGKNLMVTNTLIDMYTKCGALDKAREVFDAMTARNVVSWTTLIAGYTENGPGEEALGCYQQMQIGGFSPDLITFCCVLKACGSIGAVEEGQEIHAQIARTQLLRKHILVANALIDMYARCGALDKAQEVFDLLSFQDLISWNALIAGFVQHGYSVDALSHLDCMLHRAYLPNEFTFACIFKACGNIGALNKALRIHAQIILECLQDRYIAIGTALVDMYAKHGEFNRAQKVFEGLPARDVVSWNALISGFVHNGHGLDALQFFEAMQCEGLSPDGATLACILKAFCNIHAVSRGQKLHMYIVKHGFSDECTVVGNALIDMYANCCMLSEAHDVFDKLLERDVISWNALIGGNVQYEYSEKALICYQWMLVEGFSPDAITFAYILKACADVGFACKGQHTHAAVVKHGFLGKGMTVDNGLLVMYSSFGMLAEAQNLFENLLVQDLVSWSALMVGYAQYGKDEIVFFLFDRMICEGIEPDAVVLTIVLYTCSHSGLVEEGLRCFGFFSKESVSTIEHYASIVDLFCRTGQLDKAVVLIENIPFSADRTMWRTLLGACYKWMDKQLGRWAFDHAVQLNEKDASAYVCLSNVYATAGDLKDKRIEAFNGTEPTNEDICCKQV